MIKKYKMVYNKKIEMRFIILISVMLIIILSSISQVSAYKRLCLVYGQSIPNAENPRYTCWHDQCQVCVTDLNNPTRPNYCYDIEGCEAFGNYELDETPPEINILLPIEGGVYSSLAVTYEITSNEPAILSLTENGIDWRRLMSTTQYYKRKVTSKEGLNEVTVKARDKNGNEVLVHREFVVDTRKPIITRTYPLSGFVNSVFTIEYTEENIDEIKLHYGNSDLGYQEAILQDCPSGSRQQCSIDAELSFYDGHEIEYWFVLEDIASRVVESRKVKVFVDESVPEIINVEYEVKGRNVYFNIGVDEAFLQEVGYSYVDERGGERERRLCSRLDNGVCEGRGSFSDGEREIIIYALDKAGNRDEEVLNFFVDSKNPRIIRTYPMKGFANGDFDIEFQEENPVELILYYGVEENIRNRDVDLNLCSEGRKGYSCNVNADLKDFNGEEIEYWFEIEDILGQKDKSRVIKLNVDTDFPVLLNPDTFWEQGEGRYNRYVYFNLEIGEDNFEETVYIDWSDRRPSWKRLCSRLKDGVCTARKSFRTGHHIIDVQINDKAGNSIGERIEFDV